MQPSNRLVPTFIGENHYIVANAIGRPEPDDGGGPQGPLSDNLVKHLASIVKQAAGGRAEVRVLEDRRILASKLPSGEERRPIDVVDQLLHGIVRKHLSAEPSRPRRTIAPGPIQPR